MNDNKSVNLSIYLNPSQQKWTTVFVYFRAEKTEILTDDLQQVSKWSQRVNLIKGPVYKISVKFCKNALYLPRNCTKTSKILLLPKNKLQENKDDYSN